MVRTRSTRSRRNATRPNSITCSLSCELSGCFRALHALPRDDLTTTQIHVLALVLRRKPDLPLRSPTLEERECLFWLVVRDLYNQSVRVRINGPCPSRAEARTKWPAASTVAKAKFPNCRNWPARFAGSPSCESSEEGYHGRSGSLRKPVALVHSSADDQSALPHQLQLFEAARVSLATVK